MIHKGETSKENENTSKGGKKRKEQRHSTAMRLEDSRKIASL